MQFFLYNNKITFCMVTYMYCSYCSIQSEALTSSLLLRPTICWEIPEIDDRWIAGIL